MDLKHIAVVPLVDAKADEVTVVAAALQKQVPRDFAPIWDVTATVDYFPALDVVPLGYWPVFVVEQAPAAGTHIDHGGQPIAYVEYGPSWSLSASHEVLEMLADPAGTRLIAGDSPTDGERVEFLVEVCDPCQDATNAYTVNGVLVSDFYTPAYFEPSFTQGSKYSFCGTLRKPRDVLPGGYLTWRSPTSSRWFQIDGNDNVKDLGLVAGSMGFRNAIDTASPRRLSHLPADHERMRAVAARAETNRAAIEHRRNAWTKLAKSHGAR